MTVVTAPQITSKKCAPVGQPRLLIYGYGLKKKSHNKRKQNKINPFSLIGEGSLRFGKRFQPLRDRSSKKIKKGGQEGVAPAFVGLEYGNRLYTNRIGSGQLYKIPTTVEARVKRANHFWAAALVWGDVLLVWLCFVGATDASYRQRGRERR